MISSAAHSWLLVIGIFTVLLSPIPILIAIILWETVVFRDDIRKVARATILYLAPVSTIIAVTLLITEHSNRPDYGYGLMKLLFVAVIIIDWIMVFFGKARIKSSFIELD